MHGRSGPRIGIDVGGTFTDGILVDGASIRVAKVPSRPRDTAGAILECCAKLGADLREVSLLIHGTTLATNAIIEKTGAPIAHVTTAGYRDILYIRRGDSQPYDLAWEPPTPVVRRRDIYEVPERIAADGSVLRDFDDAAARRVARIVREKGYAAVSVVFLHSYRNDAHERRMRAVFAEECPELPVCLSCEVLPHYREFERSTTTAVNAYLLPLMADYLELLRSRLAAAGFDGEPLTMQSNGGVMTLDDARRLPARTARSGPAGGTIAAVRLA
jgi:N-methylhydantoinase A